MALILGVFVLFSAVILLLRSGNKAVAQRTQLADIRSERGIGAIVYGQLLHGESQGKPLSDQEFTLVVLGASTFGIELYHIDGKKLVLLTEVPWIMVDEVTVGLVSMPHAQVGETVIVSGPQLRIEVLPHSGQDIAIEGVDTAEVVRNLVTQQPLKG